MRTYMYWPSTSSVNVFELARAGFVFTGMDDVVKCFQCKGTLKMWKPGDDPMDGHREYYPDCPHVMALDALKKPVNTQTQLDDLLTVCEGVGYRLRQLHSLQRKTSGVEPGRENIMVDIGVIIVLITVGNNYECDVYTSYEGLAVYPCCVTYYNGTPPYNHLVMMATSCCPEQVESPVSHFLSFTTSLIQPPRFYDHIFTA